MENTSEASSGYVVPSVGTFEPNLKLRFLKMFVGIVAGSVATVLAERLMDSMIQARMNQNETDEIVED